MYSLYMIADYAFPCIIMIGLILSWKVATARWFLISYLTVILINLSILPITITWQTHYYLAEIIVAIVFILPIIYRRDIALFLFSITNVDFFHHVYKKQLLSAQECMIVLIVAVSIVVNLLTWLEILAYKGYLIDNVFFKLHFRDNIILCIKLILCGCILTYAVKSETRELKNEDIEY